MALSSFLSRCDFHLYWKVTFIFLVSNRLYSKVDPYSHREFGRCAGWIRELASEREGPLFDPWRRGSSSEYMWSTCSQSLLDLKVLGGRGGLNLSWLSLSVSMGCRDLWKIFLYLRFNPKLRRWRYMMVPVCHSIWRPLVVMHTKPVIEKFMHSVSD